MTEYPARVKSWTARRDLQDLVVAADVNTIYDEVTAMQQDLGAGGVRTSPTWGSGSFDNVTLNWTSLKDRLANIEYGLHLSFNQRVSTSGGSVIQSAADSTVSLTLRAKSGQTANLLEARTSAGSVVASVSTTGTLYASVIDGGTA